MIIRYVRALFTPFFRWWWAALTGFFTIVGSVAAFNDPIVVGPVLAAALVFLVFTLLFLVLSAVAVSYRWYCVSVHPDVVRVVPEKTGESAHPLTFVIRPGPEPLPVGSLLALFRTEPYGVEVCAAILEVKGERVDGDGFQAEPRWMSPSHKTDVQRGKVSVHDLRVRAFSGQVVSFIENSLREDR
jgi:hypothetical protein